MQTRSRSCVYPNIAVWRYRQKCSAIKKRNELKQVDDRDSYSDSDVDVRKTKSEEEKGKKTGKMNYS